MPSIISSFLSVRSQPAGYQRLIPSLAAREPSAPSMLISLHPIKLAVVFDELTLPDGSHIPLHAAIAPGSGQVIRLVTADEHRKNAVKDAAAQKMEQVRMQWNNAMKQVESPGKTHRIIR